MDDQRNRALVKTLFRSPIQNRQISWDSDVTEEILTRAQLEQETEASLHWAKLDNHKQRLENLRQKLNTASRTAWLYPSIKQLTGLE